MGLINEINIKNLVEQEILTHLDVHFARFLLRLDGKNDPALFIIFALLSNSNRKGHICLDLNKMAGSIIGDDQAASAGSSLTCPDYDTLISSLSSSSVVGKPGDYRPVILDDSGRLYLYRYWDYEQKLASSIKERTGAGSSFSVSLAGLDEIKKIIDRLFPGQGIQGISWQKIAAFACLYKNFCAISGGPGTGKTFTVSRILALLLKSSPDKTLKIALAAPTGKAAQRLQESINSSKATLDCPDVDIPVEASTIHRLLGTIPDSPYFRFNSQNKLPVDVVVVDEASMVDLALMSKLVQALPANTRLILLGDRDQLASVEAGAVFGDICGTGSTHFFSNEFSTLCTQVTDCQIENQMVAASPDGNSPVSDSIIELKQNYRFKPGSGIGELSRCVNAGDGNAVLTILKNTKFPDVSFSVLPSPHALGAEIEKIIIQGFSSYFATKNSVDAFELFKKFRILCAVRIGHYGVVSMNQLVEKILAARGLIPASATSYSHRPVLINTNDYNLKLFNGDTGIMLPDPEAKNGLRVFFEDKDGEFRKFLALRLPANETVYAMTIHKSQGSEFDNVLLVLPDRDYPVLTRELLYTGVTRAKNHVHIIGTDELVLKTVSRRLSRTSGLRDALWMKE